NATLGPVDLEPQAAKEPLQQVHHALPGALRADVDIQVVRIAGEAVSTSLQLLIHLVQQDVCKQGRQWPSLRRPFMAFHHYAVGHDTRLQVATDKPQHPLVIHSAGHSVHEDVVVDPVEELLQVDIHHDASPILDE